MSDATTFEQANAVQRVTRRIAALGPVSKLGARIFHRIDAPVFRWTRGRHSATSIVTGLPAVILITTGARSGQRRSSPVLGFPTAEGLVVIASNFGQNRHPAWCYNLRAHPDGEVVVRGVRRRFHAVEIEGAQRERIWREALAVYPGWDAYERRASNRRIPVFVLEEPRPDDVAASV